MNLSITSRFLLIVAIGGSTAVGWAQAVDLPQPAAARTTPSLSEPVVVESADRSQPGTEMPMDGKGVDSDVSEKQLSNQALQDQLRSAIQTLEFQGGPFDQQLIEPLQNLADILIDQGDYSEALQLYGRLLHISRINGGLFSDNQFPIIEKIIDGNLAVQDWRALDDSQEYYYFLSKRLHAGNREQLLKSMLKKINWKLAYIGLHDHRDKSPQLQELDDISELAVALGENQPGIPSSELGQLFYKRALIHYYILVPEDIASETGVKLIAAGPVGPSKLELLDYNPASRERFRQMRDNNQFENEQILQVVKVRLSKGKKELEKMVENFKETGDQEAEALSRVYLADWNLLMNHRSSAFKEYGIAFKQLRELGIEKERVEKVFSKPVAIPAAQAHFSFAELEEKFKSSQDFAYAKESSESSPEPLVDIGRHYAWTDSIPGVGFPDKELDQELHISEEHYLDVEFDIILAGKRLASRPNRISRVRRFSGKGNATNVRVMDAHTSKDQTRREALEDIDQLMFRPRIVDGQAVATTRARMRYVFAPDQ